MISDEAVEAFKRFYRDRGVHLNHGLDCHLHDALEAALPHLLDREKVGAMLDDIDGGLELLRLAVAAQDPKDEVLFRVKELVADVEHLRSLAHPQKGVEGC